VSKDQAIGGLIFLVCIIVIIGYIGVLFFPVEIARMVGWQIGTGSELTFKYHAIAWLVAIPVLIALVAVLGIGAWIGWTMATTPPPKPIEEIEAEEKKEEAKAEEEKAEEKKAEEKKK
jgi:predicted DNA-binding transcriptional regulator